jgi:hypothetical protein
VEPGRKVFRRNKLKLEYKAELAVNAREIELNPFVESYVAHVAAGIVESLKGVDYLNRIEIKQDGEEIKIAVNGDDIPLTPFPNDLIANTIKGMVSDLKGVDEIKALKLVVNIKRA